MKTIFKAGIVVAGLFAGIALGRDGGAFIISKYLNKSTATPAA